MPNWQRAEDLLGETVREMGILIVVLAPLETLFADRPIDYVAVSSACLLGALLIACGILIESRN